MLREFRADKDPEESTGRKEAAFGDHGQAQIGCGLRREKHGESAEGYLFWVL